MKMTIIVNSPKANLPLLLNAAVAAILSGNDDGTYGLGGKKKGDYTLASWPKNGIDCLACAGSAFTLPPSGAKIEVVPLLAMEPEQADTLRKAVDAKDHASYLCYMLLRRLNQVVSLKQVLEFASRKEWCPDDVISEFFDTNVDFVLNFDGMAKVNPDIPSKRSDGEWSFQMDSTAFAKWMHKHNLSVEDGGIYGSDGCIYGTAPDYEEAGCCEAEGHTIPSLLAMWQERTDKIMELMKVGRPTDTQ